MTQKVKILAGAAILVLIMAGASFAYNRLKSKIEPVTQEETASAAENTEKMKAPDFSVEDAEGNPVSLSDMEGKPVVLNFWASWCPPCKAEMPEFEKLYTELGGEVFFMMVDLTDGRQETREKGAAYVAEQGFTFPVYFDTQEEAAYAYGIRSIPTTVFIDRDGYLVTGAEGQIDEKTIRRGISMIWEANDTSAEYHKITPEEAHKKMAELDQFILLDVRTEAEYREKRIDGARLIPDYEINDRAEAEIPDLNMLILVYCRTGRRSANAAEALVKMGYTQVYDFGGITDWPYETVSD